MSKLVTKIVSIVTFLTAYVAVELFLLGAIFVIVILALFVSVVLVG